MGFCTLFLTRRSLIYVFTFLRIRISARYRSIYLYKINVCSVTIVMLVQGFITPLKTGKKKNNNDNSRTRTQGRVDFFRCRTNNNVYVWTPMNMKTRDIIVMLLSTYIRIWNYFCYGHYDVSVVISFIFRRNRVTEVRRTKQYHHEWVIVRLVYRM